MKNLKTSAVIALAFSGGLVAGNYDKPIVYDETNPNHAYARAIEANIAKCPEVGCSEADIERMREEWKTYYDKI